MSRICVRAVTPAQVVRVGVRAVVPAREEREGVVERVDGIFLAKDKVDGNRLYNRTLVRTSFRITGSY